MHRFTAPRMMRIFRSVDPKSRQLYNTMAIVYGKDVITVREAMVVVYDHRTQLALKICDERYHPDEYFLIEELGGEMPGSIRKWAELYHDSYVGRDRRKKEAAMRALENMLIGISATLREHLVAIPGNGSLNKGKDPVPQLA